MDINESKLATPSLLITTEQWGDSLFVAGKSTKICDSIKICNSIQICNSIKYAMAYKKCLSIKICLFFIKIYILNKFIPMIFAHLKSISINHTNAGKIK